MESNLNPKESFAIIEAVINERKRRYEENGIFLMFWGALVAITGVAQFLMLRFDFYPEKSGYLWLCTMVLGFILTAICKFRQGRKNRGERQGKSGLAHTGDVLDQEVAAGEEGGHGRLDGLALADDDALNALDEGARQRGRSLRRTGLVGRRGEARRPSHGQARRLRLLRRHFWCIREFSAL